MRSYIFIAAGLLLGSTNAFAVTIVEAQQSDRGAVCGGFPGNRCGEADYCDYPEAGVCGIGDQTGICKPRPEICTQDFNPVCGCDGETHSTACHAAAAGTDVAYVGVCRSESPARQ